MLIIQYQGGVFLSSINIAHPKNKATFSIQILLQNTELMHFCFFQKLLLSSKATMPTTFSHKF